jgi:hypothetical protein
MLTLKTGPQEVDGGLEIMPQRCFNRQKGGCHPGGSEVDNVGRRRVANSPASQAVVSQVGVDGIDVGAKRLKRFRQGLFAAVYLPDKDGGRYLMVEEVLDEFTADKPGRPGDEYMHINFKMFLSCVIGNS